MALRFSPKGFQLGKLIPFRGPIKIKRSAKTYLHEQGWRLTYEKFSPQLEGWYRCRYGSYRGKIQQLFSKKPSLFIQEPPKELRRHIHWRCFSDRGNGWYSVHFSTVPKDLDSAVLHIERVLNEAFQLAKKTA